MKKKNRKISLRRRWMHSTVRILCAIGVVCIFAVTACFAVVSYKSTERDLTGRAKTAEALFADNDREQAAYYQACVDYVQSQEAGEMMELQFLGPDGTVAAASRPERVGFRPQTPEIEMAMTSRGTVSHMGADPGNGEHVMTVSVPVIYGDGEVAGVLRHVVAVRSLNLKIMQVALISLAVAVAVAAVVVWNSDYYIRTILKPVTEITEKARRIANGSYGAQIQARYNDELGALAETINDMSAQISQNEKTQTEFISSLSHELRTPLTVITGWSETILDSDALDAETSRGMRIISREAKRLTEMVVDLLDFTRIQDGRMTLNVEKADIRGEFEDTVYMYGSRLQQDGIALVYLDNDEDIPEIPCDVKRLRQVFLNVLDNAAKHGGEGKRIEASISMDGSAVVVKIRDFGPGIPEDEIPLVKKKFYKGSSKARGSGIGLAVCDEIVEMHGGTLTLENAEGGGTLVLIRLPGS